jgi:hypothetical protein
MMTMMQQKSQQSSAIIAGDVTVRAMMVELLLHWGWLFGASSKLY